MSLHNALAPDPFLAMLAGNTTLRSCKLGINLISQPVSYSAIGVARLRCWSDWIAEPLSRQLTAIGRTPTQVAVKHNHHGYNSSRQSTCHLAVCVNLVEALFRISVHGLLEFTAKKRQRALIFTQHFVSTVPSPSQSYVRGRCIWLNYLSKYIRTDTPTVAVYLRQLSVPLKCWFALLVVGSTLKLALLGKKGCM